MSFRCENRKCVVVFVHKCDECAYIINMVLVCAMVNTNDVSHLPHEKLQ